MRKVYKAGYLSVTMENEEQQEPTPQEDLKSTVDRLEKANVEKERLLAEEKELAAKQLLGGQTQKAPEPQPQPEETPKEYANRLYEGKVKFEN